MKKYWSTALRSQQFTFSVSTMGCKANLTDSQSLESRLRAIGGQPVVDENQADIFVLNTCTVTDQADKEALQILRKQQAKLSIVTGCFAEVDPARLESASAPLAGRVIVARNSAKQDIASVVEEWLQGTLEEQRKLLQGDRVEWHADVDFPTGVSAEKNTSEHRTRAFLKVQDGCNAYCSYCIIPRARGKSRSVPAQDVIREVQHLVEAGTKELVLTAIHAADYEDAGLDFTGLVEKVLVETKIPRLRLTSLDPAEIPSRLIDLMTKNQRLCAHFHVSLQSGNSRVLEAMKRAYTQTDAEHCFLAIAQKLPHAFVGMDIIAGFPGESDEEFNDSYEFLARMPWSKLHVFPFSVRQGTYAAKLVAAGAAVPSHKIYERAKRMRDLSERKMREAMEKKIGSMAEVLVEEKTVSVDGRICSQGYSRSYHKIVIPGVREPNSFVRVKIVGLGEKEFLKGELL